MNSIITFLICINLPPESVASGVIQTLALDYRPVYTTKVSVQAVFELDSYSST